MSRAVGYAHPWDIDGDPAAADRAAALGLDAVAVAAAYHMVRAASPLNPRRRLVEARQRPVTCRWVRTWGPGRRLHPAPPSWPRARAQRGPFGRAREALRARRLETHGSFVVTHNSLLGRTTPS